MKILLTGFAPWARHSRNPSGEISAELGGHVLPVEYRAAERELRRLISRERPDAIVMLGLAESRRRICLEAVALNVDHCEDRPWRRWRRPIGKGPLAVASRLPLDALYRRLRAARIPAAVSHHAGTFICNHVFYVALTASRVPCGFVHLPPFKALPPARQRRAVRAILDALARPRAARRSAPPRARSRTASRR